MTDALKIQLGNGFVSLIDGDDAPFVLKHKWYVQTARYKNDVRRYAARRVKIDGAWKIVLLHREILNAPNKTHVDHINRDTLDNRRSNIRVCTVTQNLANKVGNRGATSKYKGVYWNKARKKWAAEIMKDAKAYWLGFFLNEDEAARAYDAAAIEKFGEFARLNFSSTNSAIPIDAFINIGAPNV